MKHTKLKRVVFNLILILPWTILLLFLAASIFEIKRINEIKHRDIYKAVDSYLSQKEAAIRSFLIPNDGYPEISKLISLNESDTNVFLFGGSSVIISDGKLFYQYLEEELEKNNPSLKILNFAVMGIDSFSAERRLVDVFEAIKIKPDLIIFYMGHNDYTNVYHFTIARFYDSFDFFLKPSYFFSDKKFDYFWFASLKRPIILKVLQQLKLINILDENYGSYNELILEYFKKKMEETMGLCLARKIPVILVTPVGNLRVEPYGDIKIVTDNFKRGLRSSNYEEAIDYLTEAKDGEILTADVRVKSELNDYLRSINRPHVYIFDLEKKLKNERFEFGNSDFLDYFHFNDKTHKLVADYLYEFIMKTGDLRKVIEEKEN